MKNLIISLFKKYKSFIIYSFIGVEGLFVEFGTYYLFTRILDINYFIANISAIALAVLHNFILNNFFNFKTKDKVLLRLISFYSVALIGLVLSNIFLYIFFSKIGINDLIVKILSMPIIVAIQFYLNTRVTFKKSKKNE